MKRLIVLSLLTALLVAGCAVTTSELRLDMLDIDGIPEAEVAEDVTALRARVEGLWGALRYSKLTTQLTKERIAPYFENDKDMSDFIAIYASLFREKQFAREVVQDFEIERIVVEPNGVLARVEVRIWGKIYSIFQHRIHEVQLWKNVEGVWVMKPITY